MNGYPAQSYVGLEAKVDTERPGPGCPFCGGVLIRLPHSVRCSQCLFEFCEECGGVDRED
jgi:hypothetical protein